MRRYPTQYQRLLHLLGRQIKAVLQVDLRQRANISRVDIKALLAYEPPLGTRVLVEDEVEVKGGEWPRSAAHLYYHRADHDRSVWSLPKGTTPGRDNPVISRDLCGGRLHPGGDGYQVVCKTDMIQPLQGTLRDAGKTPQAMDGGV